MHSTLITAEDRGVYPIAITPFDEAERIDFESVDRLVDFYIASKIQGLTLLGVLGEPQKLTDDEALLLVRHVLARVAGRIKVIVGLKQSGLAAMETFALECMAAGASGVMISPPGTIKQEEQLHLFFKQVTSRLGDTPIVLQDFPRNSGVFISVPTLGALIETFPSIRVIKHEEDGGLRKISRLRKQEVSGRRRTAIWVGNSGIHLPQELNRGADGANTGIGFPEILVRVCSANAAGQTELAEDLYDAVLPLIRHEHQPGVGLAVRKEIYKRRGIIACATLRAPGPSLDATDHAELSHLLARFGRRLAQFGRHEDFLAAPIG